MQSGLTQKSNLLKIFFQKGDHALKVIVKTNFEFMTYLFVSHSCKKNTKNQHANILIFSGCTEKLLKGLLIN